MTDLPLACAGRNDRAAGHKTGRISGKKIRPVRAKLLGRGGARVPLLETFHATFGVQQLGRTREERMAMRARVHVHLLNRRTRMNHASARAGDRGFAVFRMNVFFHISIHRPVLWPLVQ